MPANTLPISVFAVLLFMVSVIHSCQPKRDHQNSSAALLGAGFGIEHTSFLVRDLEKTRTYFADTLGFNIALRDSTEKAAFDGTTSASVYLPDGSRLEFIAVSDTGLVSSKYPFISRFLKHQEGVRFYSLSTSSANGSLNWLASQGLKIDSLRSGRSSTALPKGWDWDDGGAQWRSVGFDYGNPPAHLPDFVEQIQFPYQIIRDDWVSYYSWSRTFSRNVHPNGVVGLVALEVVVDNLKAARKEFRKIGFTELDVDDTNKLARFHIARNQELHLIAPRSSGDDRDEFLKIHGPAIFALRFEVKHLDETRDFLTKRLPDGAMHYDSALKRLTVLGTYARGVQLEFVEETEEQATMAQIYNFQEDVKLDSIPRAHASALYIKYCALCHGNNREGYAADNAPSLKSHSLMATTHTTNYLRHVVNYGRAGTAMAAYSIDQGGPLNYGDVELLLQWLYESSGVEKPVELSTEAIPGEVELGSSLYAKHCVACHGKNGEGVTAPALGNPMFLATASDAFLRYAIAEGRDSTPMVSFKDRLSAAEMDAVTAYLRSRASGWDVPRPVTVATPLPKDYVLNPAGKSPKFTLREDLYVSSEQVLQALKDSLRVVILDARSKAAWRQTHIPGAIPVPYYEEPDSLIRHIPKDSTWIVAYCACPHAASERVVSTLRRFGFKNTAIIDEGILVWTQRGYPVQHGQ